MFLIFFFFFFFFAYGKFGSHGLFAIYWISRNNGPRCIGAILYLKRHVFVMFFMFSPVHCLTVVFDG